MQINAVLNEHINDQVFLNSKYTVAPGWLELASLLTDSVSVLWAIVTSTLHPPLQRNLQAGDPVGFVVSDTHLHPAACHCYFTSVASLRKEAPGDCVCFNEGVFDICVCVCVHVMTQYKFNTGAFLCSCHPDTRLRSVGNSKSGVKHT